MAGRPGTSVRQRRVSAELRALRQARGLTCEQVAEALGCSIGKISRMETGERGLYVDDVSALLGFLRAPASLREELLGLVRDGHKPNWIQVGSKLPTAWKQLIDFEEQAVALYNYESMLVPGLLQTGDYARTVIKASNKQLSEAEVDNLVRTRMARQAVLSRYNGPTLSVILDENVLARYFSEKGLLDRQLQHVINLAKRPRIDIRVVQLEKCEHPGLAGPFMIMEFRDQPTLVHIESWGASGLLEEASVVRSVKLAWQELHSMALPPAESMEYIHDFVDHPTGGTRS